MVSLGTVLLVDDDPGVRDSTRIVLTRAGYEVLTAADGDEAIEMMSRADIAARVNALLCDLEMPNCSGSEVIDHMTGRFPHIPIVVLSGATDSVYLDGIVKNGVGDWIRKPATREQLLVKVHAAVRLSTLRTRQGA